MAQKPPSRIKDDATYPYSTNVEEPEAIKIQIAEIRCSRVVKRVMSENLALFFTLVRSFSFLYGLLVLTYVTWPPNAREILRTAIGAGMILIAISPEKVSKVLRIFG